MADCSFCGESIAKGTGFIFVKTDGKVLNFCSRKCEKHVNKLKHKARNIPWTKEARDLKKDTQTKKAGEKK